MEEKTKGWISKLFTFAVLAALIVQAIKVVDPIVKDNSRSDGVCNITNFYWLQGTCMRDSTFYFMYSVPVIEGYFVKLTGRPTVLSGTNFPTNLTTESFGGMFINNSYHKSLQSSGTTDDIKATLYDDYSENPLINCTSATIVSTKRLLVHYLPILEGVLDVNSTNYHTLPYYPDSYFNCTHNSWQGLAAFIQYKRTYKLLVIPFVATLLAFIGGLILIDKYDIDGPIKEFATFLLQILLMGVYALNFLFFVIIRVIIGQIIFNVDPGDPIDFLKAGSIFFPLVWLFKKARDRWRSSDIPDDNTVSPSSSSPQRVSVRSANPVDSSPPRVRFSQTQVSRTQSPELSRRPHAPPANPPSYLTIDTESTVIPNTVVFQYDGDGLNSDEILPPPPTYEEAVNNQM